MSDDATDDPQGARAASPAPATGDGADGSVSSGAPGEPTEKRPVSPEAPPAPATRETGRPAGMVVTPPKPPAVVPRKPDGEGLLSALPYVFRVARGRRAQRREQRRLRRLLAEDQKGLDGVLGEIGRAVREERLDVAALGEAIAEVDGADHRRKQALIEADRLFDSHLAEDERLARQEVERRREVDEQDAAVRRAEKAWDKHRRAVEAVREEHSRVAGELQFHEGQQRRGGEKRAAAEAAQDPEALEARARISHLSAERDERTAELVVLERESGGLQARLADARGLLQGRRAALADVVERRRKGKLELERAQAQLAEDQRRAGVEMGQHEVHLGTLANLRRVKHARLAPLYARVDEIKATSTGREELIAACEREARAYDPRAYRRGWATLAVATLLLLGGAGVAAWLLLLR